MLGVLERLLARRSSRVASSQWEVGELDSLNPGVLPSVERSRGSPAAAPFLEPRRRESPRGAAVSCGCAILLSKMPSETRRGLPCQSSRGAGGRARRGPRYTYCGPEQPKFNCKYRDTDLPRFLSQQIRLPREERGRATGGSSSGPPTARQPRVGSLSRQPRLPSRISSARGAAW